MIVTLVVAGIAAVALTIHATTPQQNGAAKGAAELLDGFPARGSHLGVRRAGTSHRGKNVYVASHAAHIPGQICGLCSYRGIEKRI